MIFIPTTPNLASVVQVKIVPRATAEEKTYSSDLQQSTGIDSRLAKYVIRAGRSSDHSSAVRYESNSVPAYSIVQLANIPILKPNIVSIKLAYCKPT